MALSVGTDTYISLADANTYWTENTGGTNWAIASDTEKEKALRAATQYVDKHYSWLGVHPGTDQALSWPRLNVIDKNGRVIGGNVIPDAVKDAVAYIAEQVLADGGILPKRNRNSAIKSVKAGSVEVEYDDQAPTRTHYDYADLLLSKLTKGGRGMTPMIKG